MKIQSTLLVMAIAAQMSAPSAQAAEAKYKGPGKTSTVAKNQEIFKTFCTGEADSTDAVGVNYENAKVKKASKILSKVADTSFYMYADIKRMYPITEDTIPKGVTKNAHTFLKILCGEFRDRASMISAKIRWIHNMVMPGNEKQKKIVLGENLWAQMSGQSYKKYLGT